MTILVELHTDSAVFDTLREEWTALLDHAAVNTFFLTPEYKQTWWRNLGQGALHLLTAREEGRLLGVAPLFLVEEADRGTVLQTIGCVEVSDYLDWVAAAGREEEVLGRFVDFLAGPDGPPWDVMDLCNIHRDSPTLRHLPELGRAHGWEVETEVQEVCPVVDLPSTWEAYMELLDGRDRRELRRKLRRAEADSDIRWYIVGPEQDLGAEMEDFVLLMAKSSPEKAAFLTPPMRAFFHELARVAFAAGWLQLSFLTWRDQKLASYLNFVYNDRVLVYNSGFDWETYSKLGAGVVLTGYLIQHAIDAGYEEYDFLRGDEAYKYSFGGVDVTVHRLLARR